MINLDFFQPFEAHHIAEFMLEAKADATDATDVTWRCTARLPYIAKLMHLFWSMDRIVGKDFEADPANMKAVAEK